MKEEDPGFYPAFRREEEAMLAAVDRSMASLSKTYAAGYNGEVALCDFLNRYLPPVVSAATGRIGLPNGELSSLIDVLILDTRYPLLSRDPDGLVLVPLHAVVAVLTVTMVLDDKNFGDMIERSAGTLSLSRSLSHVIDEDGPMKDYGFVYRSALRTDQVHACLNRPENGPCPSALYILRLPPDDEANNSGLVISPQNAVSKDGLPSSQGDASILREPLRELCSDLVRSVFATLGVRKYDDEGVQDRLAQYEGWSCFSRETYRKNDGDYRNSLE